MLFKPRTIDEACVQAQYLENIGHKKGQPSGSKQNITKMLPRRGRRSGKGKTRRWTTTTHQCKDPNNHCNHCNIDGHIEDKVLEATSIVESKEP
jgi:hypothetical protein